MAERYPDRPLTKLPPAPASDRAPPARADSSLKDALERVIGELRAGLAHGFFDYSMSCEIVRGGKRRFTLRAGKSHRFVIPEEEIE